MIRPPFLKPGDKVTIVATARKVSPDVIEAAVRLLSSWGLDVRTGPNLFRAENQFAGSEEERISALQQALDDEEIRAVICARGGYGTLPIIDSVSFEKFQNLPKWVIGYSDVTVLHSHIQQVFGVQSLHASMPVNFHENSPESLDLLRSLLFGKLPDYSIEGNPLNRTGRVSGELIGGNLSILYSLMGSLSFPQCDGQILFIEDLDEYLYHIHRMMTSLRRSGLLAGITGLVVGSMSEMRDNQVPFGKTAYEIIAAVTAPYDYPVCFGFPAGHLKDNRPLVLGAGVKLEVSENSVSLSFSS